MKKFIEDHQEEFLKVVDKVLEVKDKEAKIENADPVNKEKGNKG